VTIGALPLFFVAASSVSSSGFDLSRKLLARDLRPLPMVCLLTLSSAPLFALAVAFGGGVRIAPAYFAPAIGSLVLNIVANLAFVESVRIAPLSLTVPLLSLTPAFTTILGFFVLGERPPATAWLGVLLVVAGAFWLHVSAPAASAAGADATAAAPGGGRLASLAVQPGAWLMALTAFLWSLTIPLDKLAIGHASAPFHGFFLTAGGALGTFAILAAGHRLAELRGIRGAWAPFVAALVASTLDLGFQLAAIHVLLVSVVETLKRGLGNLLAVVLGRLVFGEALTWAKLAAAVLMAGGVALIFL
jgi:drug/metabolite transporter (DMT)-like permease